MSEINQILMEKGEGEGQNLLVITRGERSRGYADVGIKSRLRMSRLVNKEMGWDIRQDGKLVLAKKPFGRTKKAKGQ